MVIKRDTIEWQAKFDESQGEVFSLHFFEKMKQSKEETTESIETSTVARVYTYEGTAPSGRCFCVDAGRKTFTMICDTEEVKNAWMREIEALSPVSQS